MRWICTFFVSMYIRICNYLFRISRRILISNAKIVKLNKEKYFLGKANFKETFICIWKKNLSRKIVRILCIFCNIGVRNLRKVAEMKFAGKPYTSHQLSWQLLVLSSPPSPLFVMKTEMGHAWGGP